MCLISGVEPADDSPPLLPSLQTSAVPHLTPSASLAVISEEVTAFSVPEAKDTEAALATELQLTATTGKPEFSAIPSNKTLPALTLSPSISSQSPEMTSGRSTTAMTGTTKSNVSLSASVDISPLFPSTFSSETSTGIQLVSSGSTKLLGATEPQTATATHAVTTRTESESKPIATSVSTGAPLRTTEMPVKTKIMELSEMATRTLPTKEAQVKQERLTTFTSSSFEPITEETTAYVPEFSTSPLDVSSYTPPVNVTGTSERTKTSVEQSFTTAANVTVTSFSPMLTTSSLLKPVPSATTEAAAVLTKQRVMTTFSPTSMPPVSLGKTTTEPPLGMVQHLTGTPEVLFTTTLGPKMTTLQTQVRSSETTLLSFTTHKKEIPKITSHVEHTSSSYFPPYSPHPSSSTEKSFILSTKRPAVSVPTPPASGELKKTFKTVSTTGYPLHMALNTTEFLTTLYTKYPVMAETMSVTPLSVEVTSKITSPLEMATKSTLFSGKISTEYKSALVSSTVKTSTPAYSGSVTTSAVKTKETITAPFVATERESLQRTSITGSPLAVLSDTETTLLTTQPDKSQIESISTISTGKPSALSFSPSGALISLNISLPSLPSDGKEALLTTLSPLHTSHEIISLYPRTTIQKSVLTTEKTSAVPTFSIFSSILEQSSSKTTVPAEKTLVNITAATFSPTSEFSSQLTTTQKITDKEKSSLSPSVVLPVTKSSYTFSTSEYLGDKLFSSPSLTQLLPEVTTAPKYSAETKMVSTALKPAVQSITEAVKLPEAAAQPSLPPSSAAPFSLQTSSGATLPAQTTRTTVVPPSSTQKTTEHDSQTSGPSLTRQVHLYPAESLTKPPDQPQPVFGTIEATVGLTSLHPLKPSLAEGTHSSVLPTSVGPTKIILPTQKYLHLTDSVTQPLVSRTSVLQPTVPAGTTADLVFGTKFPPLSPEVLASSSLTTIKEEPFPSFSTQKAATDLKFTHQALFTKSLDSKQTLEASPSPDSESTSSAILLPGTTEIPVGLGPTSGTSGTEETVVEVTPSASTSSSVIPPRTALSPVAHSPAAASASPTISSPGQNFSIAPAASDKAAAAGTEPISSSLAVPTEAKGAMPLDTARSEESELTTGLQSVLTQGVAVTPQTFHPPYFTNTASLLSTVHSPAESKPFSSAAPSSVSATQTSKFEITSEMQTPAVSSLLMVSDHPNDTAAPSVSSFTSSSTKPLHGLTTTFSDGLAVAEAMAGAAASPFMLPQETATLQTCTVS